MYSQSKKLLFPNLYIFTFIHWSKHNLYFYTKINTTSNIKQKCWKWEFRSGMKKQGPGFSIMVLNSGFCSLLWCWCSYVSSLLPVSLVSCFSPLCDDRFIISKSVEWYLFAGLFVREVVACQWDVLCHYSWS